MWVWVCVKLFMTTLGRETEGGGERGKWKTKVLGATKTAVGRTLTPGQNQIPLDLGFKY